MLAGRPIIVRNRALSRTWLVVIIAIVSGSAIARILWRGSRTVPGPAHPIDAGSVAAEREPAVLPESTVTRTGLQVVLHDDDTSASMAAVLTATGAGGREVVAQIAANGQGALPIAPGRWTISARSVSGAPLSMVRASEWEVGELPPPWIEVRVAAPVESALDTRDASVLAASSGTASLIGVATVDGVRPADLIVEPIWMGGFGPGHAATHDRVARPIALPARRFVGTGGAWRIDGLPEGGYALLVQVPWQAAAWVRTTATGAMAGDGSAALAASVQLSGAVLDQRGAEIAGATVRILYGELELAQRVSDARGGFRFVDLVAGEVAIDARAPGCFGQRKNQTLVAGVDVRVRLEIVCETPDPAQP
jgi:hypothetical protein